MPYNTFWVYLILEDHGNLCNFCSYSSSFSHCPFQVRFLTDLKMPQVMESKEKLVFTMCNCITGGMMHIYWVSWGKAIQQHAMTQMNIEDTVWNERPSHKRCQNDPTCMWGRTTSWPYHFFQRLISYQISFISVSTDRQTEIVTIYSERVLRQRQLTHCLHMQQSRTHT